jgi:tripartite-type tricarboxylate transporter receptor subunit TctC
MHRKMLRCSVLLALLLAAGAGLAQPAAYPSRPVKFIVPITPGGSNDVVARAIAQKLSESWNQPVVVENRPGAGMNLGAELVAKSPADGYTWLLGANNIFVTNPHVGKVPFDVFKDFTPVTEVANVPFVLAVNNAVPAKNVAELIAWIRQNPGKVNYASSGNGSPQHLAAEMLSHLAGLKMQHVPYKGAIPAITDLIGGQVQMFIGAVNSLQPQAREGKLRILAGAGSKRYTAFPELPAIAETVPGFALDVWLGVFMPAGVPKEIVGKVNADIARALTAPEIKSSLAAQGLELTTSTPEALAVVVRDDYARWGKVIREAGIKAD